LNQARIFDWARVVFTSESQSREGPRSFFEVSTSQMSPDTSFTVSDPAAEP
jgi:hypothetical protein